MPDRPRSNPEQFIQGAPVFHVADVIEEPVDRPYRIREFKVRDPNGIEIVFGQDID